MTKSTSSEEQEPRDDSAPRQQLNGSIRAHVREATLELERVVNEKSFLTPYTTGLARLDQILGGFRRGTLVVIGGRPSSGKTTLALRIASRCASASRPTLMLSPATEAPELVRLLLASGARIEASNLRRGLIQNHEWGPLAGAAGEIAESAFVIDDTPRMDVEFIVERLAQARKAGFATELVVLDDLQSLTLSPEMDTRVAETGSIAKRLKRLAREENLVIVCVSTMNRSAEKVLGQRPRLSELRDSGDIEDMADQVLLLFSEENQLGDRTPEARLGMLEINVAKNRYGPTDWTNVMWFRGVCRMEDPR